MMGMSAAMTGTTKNRTRLSSEVSQNDVYRCQNVGPEPVEALRRLGERQIVPGCSEGNSPQPIQRPRRRMNFADRS